MRKRYENLPIDSRVFRTVKVGGGYLPAGHILPKPEWLEPDAADKKEAEVSGRVAGISVWDCSMATHVASCWTRRADSAAQLSFDAEVGEALAVGTEHTRTLAVVADPLEHPPDNDRWKAEREEFRTEILSTGGGHSLIEGIRRPPSVSDQAHRSFREALASRFQPLSEQSRR